MQEGLFFQDLALLMTVAGCVAAVFSRFGWPKVIGFILAGILLNDHTWGGGLLADPQTTRIVGQLGVVFLMFAMGLSFSAREMKKIRAVAIPCAVVDTLVMIWLGYTLGTHVFGWSPTPSFFLGVAICDSATTLLAKVIGEMGWSDRPFARYVMGASVCEDVACVGAIAVATGFAAGNGLSLGALALSLGGLAVFFSAVLVFGLVFVPRLLVSVGRRDDEALVLTLLGCCFFVSFFAYKFSYSLALGAFLVGILGAQSDLKDRLAARVEPLKTMFAAVFFVSIGLLVDPAACLRHLPAILLVSAVVIVGKFVNNTLAALLSGVDVKTSVQIGIGLAQIGEFAFMVAILYAGLVNDAETPLFQVAVGASLLTTVLNPTMVRFSDRVGDFVQSRLPVRFQRGVDAYRLWLEKIRASRSSASFDNLRGALIRLGVCAFSALAFSVVCGLVVDYDFSRFSSVFERYDRFILYALSNLFFLGLLPMVVTNARLAGKALGGVLFGTARTNWLKPVRSFVDYVALVAAIGLYFVEWAMLAIALAPQSGIALVLATSAILLAGAFGWKFFSRAGRQAAARLQDALQAEERRERLGRMMTMAVPESAFREVTLAADSRAIGETVVSLNIRALTGASVVAVVRGGRRTRNVGPKWVFQEGDTLVAIGDPEQLAALGPLLEAKRERAG